MASRAQPTLGFHLCPEGVGLPKEVEMRKMLKGAPEFSQSPSYMFRVVLHPGHECIFLPDCL